MSIRTGILGAIMIMLLALQGCYGHAGGSIGRGSQTPPVAETQAVQNSR